MQAVKEYYTIREASNITGVSVQSIYSKIEKAEKDTGYKYTVVGDDKVKRVSAAFLKEYYGITGDEEEEARKLDVVARLQDELDRERDRNADEVARLNLEIDRLHSEIEMLMKMNLNNQFLLLQAKPEPPSSAPSEETEKNSDPEPIKKKGFFDIFRKG